jgi:hypothetical protein
MYSVPIGFELVSDQQTMSGTGMDVLDLTFRMTKVSRGSINIDQIQEERREKYEDEAYCK